MMQPAQNAYTLAGLPLPLTIHVARPMSDMELMVFSEKIKPCKVERNAKGEIEIMTPCGGDGSRFESLVISELYFWARENGGQSFSSNGGWNLPDGSMLCPDAAWISDERWNALTPEQRRSYPPVCPDFIVEVASASDSLHVLQAKMDVWISNGAKLAWLVDPYGETVRIYRPDKPIEILERPDSVEADAVVPGFRLSAYRLWADNEAK